jgi:hypothetical protein
MRRLELNLAIAILGLTALAGRAQDSPSHAKIGEWASGNNSQKALDMQKLLRDRLGADGQSPPQVDPVLIKQILDLLERNKSLDGLDRALEANPELRRALSNLQRDNPELLRQLQERRDGFRPGGMRPEDMAKLIERMRNRNRPSVPEGPGTELPNPPRITPGGSPPVTPRTESPPRGANPERPFNPPESLSSGEARSERFREFMKRMENWVPKNWQDSPGMKKFMDGLGKLELGQSTSKFKLWPDGQGPKINWDKGMQGTGRFFERMFDRFDGSRMPKLPNAPGLPNAPKLPNLGTPSAPGSLELGGTLTTILVIAAFVLGAFLFWRLIVKPVRERPAKPGEWKIGPWPVDPSRVRTREELIRAFDHLALLNGGKPARMWHHREVANRLGSADSERRETAQRLSSVYESARYAPPVEPLPDSQIDVARRDLCSLAGVGAS